MRSIKSSFMWVSVVVVLAGCVIRKVPPVIGPPPDLLLKDESELPYLLERAKRNDPEAHAKLAVYYFEKDMSDRGWYHSYLDGYYSGWNKNGEEMRWLREKAQPYASKAGVALP